MAKYGIQIIGSNGFINSNLDDVSIVEEVDWSQGDVDKTYYPQPGETYYLLEIVEEKDMLSGGGGAGRRGIIEHSFNNNRLIIKTIFDWVAAKVSTFYIVKKKVL